MKYMDMDMDMDMDMGMGMDMDMDMDMDDFATGAPVVRSGADCDLPSGDCN